MKCRKCNNFIPDGDLFCPYCGCEVQIVPDYNPLDEMLAAQIRLNNAETQKSKPRNDPGNTRTGKSKTVYAQKRALALKKRRRRAVLLTIFLAVVLLTSLFFLAYKKSYNGMVSSGYKYLEKKEYDIATQKFFSAIKKRKANPKAYIGYCQTMIAADDVPAAEKLLSQTMEEQPDNYELFKVAFDFYLETDHAMKIPEILSEASDTVIDNLAEYMVDEPEFSLESHETYDDVQELSITGKGTIYYTLDGGDPGPQSTTYQEPLQIREGETTVKAVVYNDRGVPGPVKTAFYTVELPTIDSPAVSPSTGQYMNPEKITIKVPEGYEAYYEIGGADPTVESERYTGPIDMPSGDTLFKAILVDGYGRVSAVTTRNYIAYAIENNTENSIGDRIGDNTVYE